MKIPTTTLATILSFARIIVDGKPIVNTVDSSVPSSTDVQYNCEFENQWTKDRHPNEYPTQGAVHWTRQFLVSHSDDYGVWKEGSMASSGVKQYAEAAAIAELIGDVDGKFDYEIGYTKYFMRDPLMKFYNPIRMTSQNKYLSVIARMNPSPDWFSGFHDFNAVNERRKVWYQKFTIETYPYDAGTEDGDVYDNLDNPASDPQRPISEITKNNAPGDGIYLNADGTTVLPVAKYTCTLNTYSHSDTKIETVDSTVPSSEDVFYKCAFENQWNQDRHPFAFPKNLPSVHWTKQIVASHSRDYRMWTEGEEANDGVEQLAEAGGTSTILKELQANDFEFDLGYEKYLFAMDPKVIFEPLKFTSANRYVSALSKLAPSPDWFSGFHDFNAVDEKRDTWYQRFEIPVYPYDAGTEDGVIYEIPADQERASVPTKVVKQFTMTNLLDTKVFLSKDETEILPVATYSCVLSDEDGNDVPPKSVTPNKSGKATLVVGLSVGIIVPTVIGVLVYFLMCRGRSKRSSKDFSTETSTTNPTIEVMDGDQEII